MLTELETANPQLEVEMGLDPLDIFGSAQLTPPLIEAERTLFRDSSIVHLTMDFSGIRIRYTLDGTDPDSTSPLYTDALIIRESGTVKAIAEKEGWTASPAAELDFVKVANETPDLTLRHEPSPTYAGSGSLTLVDFQKGEQNFRDGKWLGFEAQDLIGVIDLGKKTAIKRVTVSCLEDVGAWIMYPIGMEISVSSDGKNFRKVASKKYAKTKEITAPSRKHFTVSFDSQTTRYVRVQTHNVTKLPAWHPGAGGKAWLFVDEVMVE